VLLSFVRATREHAREPNILSTIHAAPPNRRDEPRHTRQTAHRSPDRGLRTPLTAAPPLRASVPPDRGRPQSADNGHPTLTAPAPAAAHSSETESRSSRRTEPANLSQPHMEHEAQSQPQCGHWPEPRFPRVSMYGVCACGVSANRKPLQPGTCSSRAHHTTARCTHHIMDNGAPCGAPHRAAA